MKSAKLPRNSVADHDYDLAADRLDTSGRADGAAAKTAGDRR